MGSIIILVAVGAYALAVAYLRFRIRNAYQAIPPAESLRTYADGVDGKGAELVKANEAIIETLERHLDWLIEWDRAELSARNEDAARRWESLPDNIKRLTRIASIVALGEWPGVTVAPRHYQGEADAFAPIVRHMVNYTATGDIDG